MMSVGLLLGHLGSLQLEDDLNIMLQWLSPQEHQSHPPSLRVKTSIKTILQHSNLPFNDCLCLYYYDIVRRECLSLAENNPTTFTYAQLSKLENKLYYPLEFIPILKGNNKDCSLNKVIYSLRHYIINSNKSFRIKLRERIQKLIEEEDFDICQKLIQWIDKSGSSELNAKGLVLDILLEKIEEHCKQEMVKLWEDRKVVESTYITFMGNYWSGFKQLLDISEDEEMKDTDNNKNGSTIPELVHDHFEKQFINRRMNDILVIIMNCFKAGPILFELRPLIKKYNLIDKLVAAFLSQFQKLILESPKNTAEILQIFIMAIDVFIYLDIRDHYLRVLTTFMKPFLSTRENFVPVYLYGVLGLKSKEFDAFHISKPESIAKLRHALKGKHLSCFTSHSNLVPVDTRLNSFSPPEPKHGMILYDVLRQYKTWVPEGLKMDPGEGFQNKSGIQLGYKVLKGRSNLITDCLLSLMDDKDILVSLLLDVIKRRLLRYASRKLEDKYLVVYLRLYQRIRNGHNLLLSTNDMSKNETDHKLPGHYKGANADDVDSELIVDDGISKTYNDRIAFVTAIDEEDEIFVKFNKINVMLHDMRESDLMDRFIKVPNPKIKKYFTASNQKVKIYPKFVSKFYWDIKKEDVKEQNPLKDYTPNIPAGLEEDILLYTRGYRKLNPGRVIRYCKDETILTVKILNIKQSIETLHDVSIDQYCVIEHFTPIHDSWGLDNLAERCHMSIEELHKAAKYWVDNKVLAFDGEKYYATYKISFLNTAS